MAAFRESDVGDDQTEVLLRRHKRATSGYNSDIADWSLEELDAEIYKLRQESVGIERRLVSTSGDVNQLLSESGASVAGEAPEPFQDVTVRDAGRRRESPAPLPAPLCSDDDGARAATSGRLHVVRHPPTVRHLSDVCTATSTSDRQLEGRLLSDVRTATSTADNVTRRGAGLRRESPAPLPAPLCSDDDGARAAPSDRAYAVRQPRGRQPTAGRRRFLPRTPTNSPVRRHVSRQQLPEQDRRSFSRRHLFADGDESAHEASVESDVSESAFVKSKVDQEYRCDVESSKISSKSLHKPKFKSVKVRSVQSESCDTVSESELSDVVKLQPKSSARLRDKREMRSKHAEAESDDDDVCTVVASRAVDGHG